MTSTNSPFNCTSIDLEREVIKRFRHLIPFLDPECRVFRQLNGFVTILCLDFTACPQDLEMNKEKWQELAKLLVYSSHYLGLANSIVFKNGDSIVSWMTLTKTQYCGQYFGKPRPDSI